MLLPIWSKLKINLHREIKPYRMGLHIVKFSFLTKFRMPSVVPLPRHIIICRLAPRIFWPVRDKLAAFAVPITGPLFHFERRAAHSFYFKQPLLLSRVSFDPHPRCFMPNLLAGLVCVRPGKWEIRVALLQLTSISHSRVLKVCFWNPLNSHLWNKKMPPEWRLSRGNAKATKQRRHGEICNTDIL